MLGDNARALVRGRDRATGTVTSHPAYFAFCRDWDVQPRACAPYRARSKGKVESGVKYVKRNALAGRARHPEHPNPERYAGQRIFVVRREDYVYLVPFVEDENTVFLKTIIPSRKATKEYLGEESDDEARCRREGVLASVERGEWTSWAAASASGLAMLGMRRGRSARTGG